MHTVDTLAQQLRNDLPDLKTGTKDGHIQATFRNGKTAKIHITDDHYTIEQSDLLGKPTYETCRTYDTLRGRLEGNNTPRLAFAYSEQVRAFLTEIDKSMEEIGWRFEGPGSVDGAVGGWMPKDYDPYVTHYGLTDLAIMRADLNEDGTVGTVQLVATGEGYDPFEQITLEGRDLAEPSAEWFRDIIWLYDDSDDDSDDKY